LKAFVDDALAETQLGIVLIFVVNPRFDYQSHSILLMATSECTDL
jgi:hypothetical protein